MTARLIRPDGTVARTWETNRPDLALTADRNFPPLWRVVHCPSAIHHRGHYCNSETNFSKEKRENGMAEISVKAP